MLCYKDRSYCVRKECTNKLCTDRLTDDIIRAAKRARLPLSLIDLGNQACYTTCDNKKLEI